MDEIATLRLIFGKNMQEEDKTIYINHNSTVYEVDRTTMKIVNPIIKYRCVYEYIINSSELVQRRDESISTMGSNTADVVLITEDEFMKWKKRHERVVIDVAGKPSGREIWESMKEEEEMLV